MKHILLGFCLFLSFPAFSQFQIGEKMHHVVAVCLEKADAVEIVNTDADKGFVAAEKVWNSKEHCMGLPVSGPVIGAVVHKRDVERAGKKVVAKVVEILVEGEVKAYFITTMDVHAPRAA